MPMIIYSGDIKKCVSINLIECPACSKSFEQILGKYVYSSTLATKVLVCTNHSHELTALEEVHIQTVLEKTIKSDRGFVQKDRKLVKRTQLMKLADYKGAK